MRGISLILLCTTLFITNLFSQDAATFSGHKLITDKEIKSRLSTINNDVVPPRFDPAVRSYINTYTVKKRKRTEAMLGRTVVYFPLFEKLLAESGMPDDLKYLSVVESALNAHAVSRSGAVGLWQFMPPTGKECGLSINSTVDERKDPEKATRAAIQYLARQYKRYGNWELALAAYNGGAGRVNRAIKRGRSKNFWKIRKHLPRETRNYIPAYIAATYVHHYYEQHNLNPIYPDTRFQKTEMVKIYSTLTFTEIEQLTGTPEYVIEFLNPSYKKNYIPTSGEGANLVLPENRMAIFKNNYRVLDSRDRHHVVGEKIIVPSNKKPFGPPNSVHFFYNVESGDDIVSLAQEFKCQEGDILKWNRLTSRDLRSGQQVLIFVSKNISHSAGVIEPLPLQASMVQTEDKAAVVDWKPIALPNKKSTSKSSKKKTKKKKKVRYVNHKIARGESLFTIAAQYEGVSVNDIIKLNDIKPGNGLEKGKKIKIKKK